MPAAYHVGAAASDPVDLLKAVVAWLVTQGWTQQANAAEGSGWRSHVSKSGMYVNLRAAVGEYIHYSGFESGAARYGIGINAGTGYSGAAAWYEQAGVPIAYGQAHGTGSFARLPPGAILGWRGFDDGADNVVVVVETVAGVFTHLGFGASLDKSGSWTGGNYFFASRSVYYGMNAGLNGDGSSLSAGCPFGSYMATGGAFASNGAVGFVRADVDSFTGKWIGMAISSTDWRLGHTGKNGTAGIECAAYPGGADSWDVPTYAWLDRNLVSEMTGEAVLLPVRLFVERTGGGFSVLGLVPSVYAASAVGQGYVAGDTFTVGPRTFMLFPGFAVLKAA